MQFSGIEDIHIVMPPSISGTHFISCSGTLYRTWFVTLPPVACSDLSAWVVAAIVTFLPSGIQRSLGLLGRLKGIDPNWAV